MFGSRRHLSKKGPSVKPAQLLWTGGWDSTFRLLQLALVEKRPVQPLYVIDVERRSTVHELRAMDRIRERALERAGDPHLIAPVQVFVAKQFCVPDKLIELWNEIDDRMHVGVQYLWLAAVADALGWSDVELSVERHVPAPTPLHAVVQAARDGSYDVPGSELFKYWSFPLLEVTKDNMAAAARGHEFLDLLQQSWHCHTPIAGRECGRCRPCRLAHPASKHPINPALGIPIDVARKVSRRIPLSRR